MSVADCVSVNALPAWARATAAYASSLPRSAFTSPRRSDSWAVISSATIARAMPGSVEYAAVRSWRLSYVTVTLTLRTYVEAPPSLSRAWPRTIRLPTSLVGQLVLDDVLNGPKPAPSPQSNAYVSPAAVSIGD